MILVSQDVEGIPSRGSNVRLDTKEDSRRVELRIVEAGRQGWEEDHWIKQKP